MTVLAPWLAVLWGVVLGLVAVVLLVVLLVDAWRSARVDPVRAFRGDRERVR